MTIQASYETTKLGDRMMESQLLTTGDRLNSSYQATWELIPASYS